MELRIGRSGLGDDWLYEYNATTQTWTMIGKYLEVKLSYFRTKDSRCENANARELGEIRA